MTSEETVDKRPWSGVPVLVTGAGGFIGSHLVEALVARGARVRALVRYTSGGDVGALELLDSQTRSSVEVVHGDLCRPDVVRAAFDGVEVAFHLGALISIPYSYQSPDEAVATNVVGTLNVLQAARHAGVRRLIHTSTSEVYGTAQTVPMDETHPLQGQSPYSASKIGADKLAESFARSFDLPVVTVRPFNTFGPRQSTRAVIPTIITQLLDNRRLRLGSLHPRRDFTFVTDTVAGFLRAAEVPDLGWQEINLGTGHDVSVGEVLGLIAGLMGVTAEVTTEPERVRPPNSEVDRLCSANGRAAEVLGWAPVVSLEDGLRQTIDWVKTHRAFYLTESYHR
jgi:dTDP-glucose 4,6-dehydratase